MREHLYQGKDTDSGEWVQGDLVTNGIDYTTAIRINDKTSSEYGQIVRVDPESVREFTGLRDKNGKRIFEGHIVRILYTDWSSKPDSDTRTLEQYLHDIAGKGTVVWDNKDCCFYVQIKGCLCTIEPGKYGYIEVIGNKWDNSELLEGGEE